LICCNLRRWWLVSEFMKLSKAALVCWLASLCFAAYAQTLSTESDPNALAKSLLGSERGMAVVGVWRNGNASYGFALNYSPSALANMATHQQPLFEIGSVSKVFTGLLVAQAIERDDLALSDTLGSLLRGKVQFASSDVAGISLQQLLTHSSCLPRQYGPTQQSYAAIESQIRDDDRVKLWSALASQTVRQAPPCAALYSNYGFAILGELLSERYGKPWETLVRERITEPLGMVDTVVTLGDKAPRFVPAFAGNRDAPAWDMKAFVGAGGIRSTAHDMLQFGRAILAGKTGALGASAERLVTALGAFEGLRIGHGILVMGPDNKLSYGHNGLTGGYQTQLTLYPDTGEVVIAMVSNREAPLSQMSIELWASRYPVRSTPIALAPQALKEYAGVFRVNPDLAITVVSQNDTLFVRSTSNSFNGYIPVDVDVFTRPAVGAQLTFSRIGGKINAIMLEQAGRVTRGQLSEEPVPQIVVLPDSTTAGLVDKYRVTRLMRTPIELDVRVQRGQLAVKSSQFPRHQVYPVAGQADRFYYEVTKAELQFERDSSGKANVLVLHENGTLRLERVAD
jgi:serine-type D-Ala-D-Ala carboxypeptidase/endopeptidase